MSTTESRTHSSVLLENDKPELKTGQTKSNQFVSRSESTSVEVDFSESCGLNQAPELEIEFQAASDQIKKEIDAARQAELARKRELARFD